jgi:hypothetical protein
MERNGWPYTMVVMGKLSLWSYPPCEARAGNPRGTRHGLWNSVIIRYNTHKSTSPRRLHGTYSVSIYSYKLHRLHG